MPQSNNAEVEIGGIFLISRNADSNNVEYYKKRCTFSINEKYHVSL